jgi:RNA polymerase primary sigma factor
MKAIDTRHSEAPIIRTKNIERYLKEIRNTEKFNKEEERNLLIAAKQGDINARNRLIKSHLKFVVACAKEFQCQNVEMSDLISVGNEGLIEAINKFDLSRENRFLTCAVWWIRYKLLDYIKQNFSLINIPFNQQEELNRLKKIKDKLDQEYESNLSFIQILECTPENTLYKLDYIKSSIICSKEISSLDSPISKDGENDGEGFSVLQDLIASNFEPTDYLLEREERKKFLKRALNELPQIQKQIIVLYYGLEDDIEHTDVDISNIFGMTSERIRQLRMKGQNRLKNDIFLQKT